MTTAHGILKRSTRIRSIAAWILLALAGLLPPASAHATLGEGRDSVESDAAALSSSTVAIRHTLKSQGPLFSVHALDSGAGEVREYLNVAGTVFAVAWSTRKIPALAPLLGSYAQEYQRKLESLPRARGPRFRVVRTNRLVLQMSGHFRALQGRAYDPSLLPEGMDANEIR